MLLTFAPNSTLFTSLPLTIGLKCGLLRLTILLGMLSLLSLFRKWFFCWRYILVMISRSLFSLTVNRFSAFPLPLSISRISFSILPSRSSSLRVIFLVWLLLCLRCFLYVRFAFCTSRNFVRDGGFPVCCSTRTSSHSSSRPLPTAASRQSDNASRSHSSSHLCTSCPGSPCTVSTCRRVYPGAVASSTSLQVPSLRRPTAYSSSMAVSDLLSRRRISGSVCCRSTVPSVSGSSVPCTFSGTSGPLSLQA